MKRLHQRFGAPIVVSGAGYNNGLSNITDTSIDWCAAKCTSCRATGLVETDPCRQRTPSVTNYFQTLVSHMDIDSLAGYLYVTCFAFAQPDNSILGGFSKVNLTTRQNFGLFKDYLPPANELICVDSVNHFAYIATQFNGTDGFFKKMGLG